MTTYKKTIEHKAIIRKSSAGGYWAEVPSMPGCFSQAETLQEMRRMIDEAMDGWEPGAVTIPHPADENAEIKPELAQAIFKHCGIPEDEVDEFARKKLKLVHASAYVDKRVYNRAERMARRYGRDFAGVLGEMLIATCETIAKARGNPFTPSPEG